MLRLAKPLHVPSCRQARPLGFGRTLLSTNLGIGPSYPCWSLRPRAIPPMGDAAGRRGESKPRPNALETLAKFSFRVFVTFSARIFPTFSARIFHPRVMPPMGDAAGRRGAKHRPNALGTLAKCSDRFFWVQVFDRKAFQTFCVTDFDPPSFGR